MVAGPAQRSEPVEDERRSSISARPRIDEPRRWQHDARRQSVPVHFESRLPQLSRPAMRDRSVLAERKPTL